MGTAVEVVQAVQAIVFNLAGVRAAPDYPPEQINAPLTAVSYIGRARYEEASLAAPGCYQIAPQVVTTLLLLPKKDLPREVETLLPYVDSLPVALLASKTLSGTVDAVDGVDVTFVDVEWGGTPMRGYRFETTVSQRAQQYS